jgi:hypothetical protein
MRHPGTSVRRVSAAVALAATAACWSICVSGGRAAATRTSSAHNASALLTEAFADARAKGSFHQELTQVAGGVHGTLENDVTLHTGRQLLSASDGARGEVEVVGNTVYLMGNQHGLKSYFKFNSSQTAVIGTNWVSVPSTNAAFASIAYDVTASTALEEVAPSGHLTEGPTRTLDGQRVIAISGGLPSSVAGGAGSRATLYVTATSDPLPVRATIVASQANHTKLSLTATLSDWGEHVAVTPPKGSQELSDNQISVLARDLAGLTVPGQPGYVAVAGQQGQAVPFGRPWGVACQPIRFAVDRSVPGWAYTQIAAVVAQARRQRIDVTLESRGGKWKHSALYYRSGQSAATSKQVTIVASTATPSTTKNQPAMQLTTDSKLDGDKHNDDLTSVRGTFRLQVVNGSATTVRRSIRQLIAWTQGIAETTDPVSGITQRSFTDGFTAGDLSAMLAMSGCVGSTTGTTTVTGIAA